MVLEQVVRAECVLEQAPVNSSGLLDDARERDDDNNASETSGILVSQIGIVAGNMAQGESQRRKRFATARRGRQRKEARSAFRS